MGSIKRRTISQRSELIYDLHEYGINPDSREIFLHSHISEMPEEGEVGVDYRMATTFEKNLRVLTCLDKKAPILVHMHSVGGNWNDGLAIYDAIRACTTTPITILAYAHARSMTSIIFQAADHRIFMPSADYLMHWGDMSYEGQGQSFDAEADWYKRGHQHMLKIYSEVLIANNPKYKNTTLDKVMEFMGQEMKLQQEWYMTPREAVDMGFGDAVLGDEGYETIDVLHPLGTQKT